jgi:hypothetical protein
MRGTHPWTMWHCHATDSPTQLAGTKTLRRLQHPAAAQYPAEGDDVLDAKVQALGVERIQKHAHNADIMAACSIGTCVKEAPVWFMRAGRELPLPNGSGWLRTHRVACDYVKQSNWANQQVVNLNLYMS